MVFTMFVTPFYKGKFQGLPFYLLVGWGKVDRLELYMYKLCLLSTGLPVPAVIISAAVSNEHYGLEHGDEIIAYVCIDSAYQLSWPLSCCLLQLVGSLGIELSVRFD